MQFQKVSISKRATAVNRALERSANAFVRGLDGAMAKLGLGGRRADYDDHSYTFLGGDNSELRRKHYDKSLRLLWKAEQHAPWSTFSDMTPAERELTQMAVRALTDEERAERERIGSAEFRALLDREYTVREKEALVAVLSKIGHGEAYAWLVAADVLKDIRSTGGKSATTMQVLEEAKHFVVLRELVHAFDVDVPRQSAWEYILMEQILRAKGLEKFFGMNVLVEGIALSIFGMLGTLPGLEILRLFHLDESRHCALPLNYFQHFPMSRWQRKSPLNKLSRFKLVIPSIPLVFFLEDDLAQLGIDSFEFGGSTIRKIARLADRAGFELIVPFPVLFSFLNLLFNTYCSLTRDDHQQRDYFGADTTRGASLLQVEEEVLGAAAVA